MEERYLFKLEGPILDNNIPLHIAIESLSNFQAIVDKSYLGLKEGKKGCPKRKDNFFNYVHSSSKEVHFLHTLRYFLQPPNSHFRL